MLYHFIHYLVNKSLADDTKNAFKGKELSRNHNATILRDKNIIICYLLTIRLLVILSPQEGQFQKSYRPCSNEKIKSHDHSSDLLIVTVTIYLVSS